MIISKLKMSKIENVEARKKFRYSYKKKRVYAVLHPWDTRPKVVWGVLHNVYTDFLTKFPMIVH